MSAAQMPLKAGHRVVPRWWWAVFLGLATSDFVFVAADAAMNRRFPTGLQAWMLVQALLATVAVGALAVSMRDLGYAIVGGLFVILAVEDWLQVLSPLRLKMRKLIHDFLPWLGEAPKRLSAPDPVDLAIMLAAAAVVVLALWSSRPANRVHVIWLSGFLALGFAFGGLFDLYNDYNWSRAGVFVEETGEAVAISGTLAYLLGVAATSFEIRPGARRPRGSE